MALTKDMRAAALRAMNWTWAEIGAELDMTAGGALRAAERATGMRQIPTELVDKLLDAQEEIRNIDEQLTSLRSRRKELVAARQELMAEMYGYGVTLRQLGDLLGVQKSRAQIMLNPDQRR